MKELTMQEIKDRLDNYLEEGNGDSVERLMVNILSNNIINMDFAFKIKKALKDDNVAQAHKILAEQAKYLSSIYELTIGAEKKINILDN